MRPLTTLLLLSTLTCSSVWAEETIVTFGSEETPATSVAEEAASTSVNDTFTANTPTTNVEKRGRTRVITVSTPDRYGTIEETLTSAMRSEARYVTRGGSGYTLVGTGQNRANAQAERFMIPSWKVFSW